MSRKLPTKIHKLQGTYRPSRHDTLEPEFETANTKAPKYLTPAAAVVWRAEALPLIEKGVLTIADVPMMGDLCQLTADYRAVMLEIGGRFVVDSARDDGATVKNPLWTVARDMLQLINSMRLQFGLTPVSRTKVIAPEKPKEESKWSKLESMAQRKCPEVKFS